MRTCQGGHSPPPLSPDDPNCLLCLHLNSIWPRNAASLSRQGRPPSVHSTNHDFLLLLLLLPSPKGRRLHLCVRRRRRHYGFCTVSRSALFTLRLSIHTSPLTASYPSTDTSPDATRTLSPPPQTRRSTSISPPSFATKPLGSFREPAAAAAPTKPRS